MYVLIAIRKENLLSYTKILKDNEKIICPFCDTTQEDFVQDYLLEDVSGKDDCYSCKAIIKLKRISDNGIEVIFDNHQKRKK